MFVVVAGDRGGPFTVVPADSCPQHARPVAMFYGTVECCSDQRPLRHPPTTGVWFDCSSFKFGVSEYPLELSEQEFAVLALLVAAPHRSWSRPEFARLIWRAPGKDPDDALVRVRVSNLRTKLGRHATAIRTYRGRGYRFHPELA